MIPQLRPMTSADLDEVLPLERALFGAEAWTRGMFSDELREPTRCYLVAEDGSALVGYAGLCVYDDIAYVQTIGVRPQRWGHGVGALLLGALLQEAARRGADAVALEVRADNERAQALYRRFGFAAVGLRRGYYQPSNADALVMQLDGVRAAYEEVPR